MAKAAKPVEAAEMFNMTEAVNPTEMVEKFRTMAEEALNKSKETFEKSKAVLDDVQKDAEAGLHTAQAHAAKISLAAIDAMRANTESAFSHFEKLVGLKSVADLFEIQTAYVRTQAEKAVDDAKAMQALYQKATEEMTAESKAAAEKAMGAFKA